MMTPHISIARALSAPPPSATNPDARLIQLGHDLTRAWQKEKAVMQSEPKTYQSDDADAAFDAAYTAAYDVCSRIVDEIEKCTASTIEGLKVKAQAFSWCYSADDNFSLHDQRTTDVRLAEGILRDLLGRGARQDA